VSKKTVFNIKSDFQVKSADPKKLGSEHRVSKALYKILFNAVNDAIMLIDIHAGAFVEVNDKFCEMTGFSRQEAKALPLVALFTQEFPFTEEQAKEYIRKALTEGPQLFEWLAQDRHGRRHWVELNLTAAPIGRRPYLIATARDIQTRKDAESKADQSEAAIKALLHAFQDSAMLLDPEGVVMAANEVAAKRLNRPLEEFIGQNIYDLLPPELVRTRKAMADEVVTSGKVIRFEDSRLGTHFYHTVYPIFDQAGRVSQFGVYAMDVTEEKKTRTELEQVKARLECLLDHSPSALYSCRHTECCRMIYFSKNIITLTGFSKEEILSDPFLWFQRIHPDDRQVYVETHRAGLIAQHQSREYRFLHKAGRYRWLLDEFNLVLDKEKNPLEYVGSLIDITATKEAQKALEISEKRYRAIVECQSDLINMYLPDTTLVFVNDAICHLFGRRQEDLIGKPFLSFLEPKIRQLVQTQLASLTPENPVGEIEHDMLMPDGRRCWLTWINYAFFDDQGQVREYQGVGRDITRRKEAEDALRESELRFRMYTESALVGVHVTQDNKFVYVNPVFAEIFGYSPQELMAGMSPFDLVHHCDRDFLHQKINERLAGIPTEPYCVKGIKKDGSIVHCETLGRLVEYQGRPAILGTLLDVTQRLRAEESLRESEQKFRLLIETMNDGLGAIDTLKRITYVNPKICELLGYQEAELVGRPLTDLLDETNQQILNKNLERRQGGDQTPYELFWNRRDGGQFPSIVSPKPLFDAQGNFKGSFAIITDITARREAEAAVQRREQYFRLLTENVSDVIGLLTAEGIISYLSPIAKGHLGYDPQELLGKAADQFVHPDEIETLCRHFAKIRRHPNKIHSAVIRMRHRNNSWHVLEVKFKNLLNNPVVNGIVINAKDITEQKDLEAALQRSARKLRSLTAQIFTTQETERRRLSLELHDELGQSLTALKLQLRAIANSLRKDQKRLKQECMHMLTYINEVVEDVRRLSHDLSPSLLENMGLQAALHHLLENFRKFYLITENLDELHDIEDFLPAEANIHIFRIFQEILTNIEKHSQATEVRVEVARSDRHLTYRIADNGRGMPSDVADRSGGVPGLGLTAISERVYMLGGILEISSNENAGTEIKFTVPLKNSII
jgi:PAS domain S-box-containing protein